MGPLCESFQLSHCLPWLPVSDLDSPGPAPLHFVGTANTEASCVSKETFFPTPQHSRPFFPFYSSWASPVHRPSVDRDGHSPSAPLLPPTQHLGRRGRPSPPPPASGASPPGWAGGAHRPSDRLPVLTCSATASRRPAAGGGPPLGARQCGVPGLAPRRGGEPRAGRQRWGWPRAETAATRLRNPSGWEPGAQLHSGLRRHCSVKGRGRGLGSPRGPPPLRVEPGKVDPRGGPGIQAGPSGIARSLRAPDVAGQEEAEPPNPPAPTFFRHLQKHAQPPVFLCPIPDGIELGVFTHREGGEANREGWRIFLILKNSS